MKNIKSHIILVCLFVSMAACAAGPEPLTYKGEILPQTHDWLRGECGKVGSALKLPEISGIACSRVTPGYIWMQSDNYEDRIIATDKKGETLYCRVNFTKKIRWDWEDMSGGVYEGKNYLFIGAFGDNDEDDSNYHIVWFEEPAIDPDNKVISITPNDIHFQYPEGKLHNCEALMYDNREQMLYIITKVYYNVCQVFSLPFRTDYGDELQTLTYVCDLGVKSDLGAGANPYKGFHLVTAADVSPDGKYILIKNHNNIVAKYSWILLWTREGDESVAETVTNRTPVVLDCYEYEWQGEAICWLDSTTFYTTSDSDGEPPIFIYKKRKSTDVEDVSTDKVDTKSLVMINNVMYIRGRDGLYTLDGRKMAK
ncbi:MAG: hypothetical protein J5823_01005 [Paludibacteraceae bacterium]|nr:hypothetical protein [Paludibacteraceae bacterium]